jgi:glutaconate CoA-transferase subunit A
VLPTWVLDAIVVVPGGAWPSYAAGYTLRDNDFYTEWDAISRDRERFLGWMQSNVLDPARERRSAPQPTTT